MLHKLKKKKTTCNNSYVVSLFFPWAKLIYRIVASRSTSRLVTCLGLFRLLMKGIFGPYVLRPLDKKLIFWIVTRVSARNYTVPQNWNQYLSKLNYLTRKQRAASYIMNKTFIPQAYQKVPCCYNTSADQTPGLPLQNELHIQIYMYIL